MLLNTSVIYCLNKEVLSSDETAVWKNAVISHKHFAYSNGIIKACISVCILFFKDVYSLQRLPEDIT